MTTLADLPILSAPASGRDIDLNALGLWLGHSAHRGDRRPGAHVQCGERCALRGVRRAIRGRPPRVQQRRGARTVAGDGAPAGRRHGRGAWRSRGVVPATRHRGQRAGGGPIRPRPDGVVDPQRRYEGRADRRPVLLRSLGLASRRGPRGSSWCASARAPACRRSTRTGRIHDGDRQPEEELGQLVGR